MEGKGRGEEVMVEEERRGGEKIDEGDGNEEVLGRKEGTEGEMGGMEGRGEGEIGVRGEGREGKEGMEGELEEEVEAVGVTPYVT